MFLFFFSLLSSVYCEEEIENGQTFKAPLSFEEHLQKLNQIKEKINVYRSQKRELLDKLDEIKDKIQKAKQEEADVAELEQEQKEIRLKIIALDSEFRHTRSKVFRDDSSLNKPKQKRIDPTDIQL